MILFYFDDTLIRILYLDFSLKMDMDEDFAFALQLSAEIDDNTNDCHISESKKPLSVVDPSWELLDPIPDIRQLFIQFDKEYFDGTLACVEVKWSARMTLCAGLCRYEGRGGLCGIHLSQPLLKLRPRSDLVNTLLHEMIHALLFVTDNNKDHDGHGPEFHKHMYRINKQSGSNITVYHSFHDEVNEYRQHWWKCEGPCSKRKPFFGVVRRAMNRAPGPNDKWWSNHQKMCGGEFKKIKEPDKPEKKKKNSKGSVKEQKSPKKMPKSNSRNIGDFMKKTDNQAKDSEQNKINISNGVISKKSNITGFKSINEKESNDVQTFSGSSKNSSSNIHGFKMTARKDNDDSKQKVSSAGQKIGMPSSEGNGKKLNGSSSYASREAYLKRLEMDIAKNKGTKRLHEKTDPNGSVPNKVQKQSKPNNVGSGKQSIGRTKSPIKSVLSIDKIQSKQINNDIDNQKLKVIKKHRPKASPDKVICIDDSADDELLSNIDIGFLNDSALCDIPKTPNDRSSFNMIDCPACPAKVLEHELNEHLDVCLLGMG